VHTWCWQKCSTKPGAKGLDATVQGAAILLHPLTRLTPSVLGRHPTVSAPRPNSAWNLVIWFSGKSLKLLCQMSDFKTKMHQIQFGLRLSQSARMSEIKTDIGYACMAKGSLISEKPGFKWLWRFTLTSWLTEVALLLCGLNTELINRVNQPLKMRFIADGAIQLDESVWPWWLV